MRALKWPGGQDDPGRVRFKLFMTHVNREYMSCVGTFGNDAEPGSNPGGQRGHPLGGSPGLALPASLALNG